MVVQAEEEEDCLTKERTSEVAKETQMMEKSYRKKFLLNVVVGRYNSLFDL